MIFFSFDTFSLAIISDISLDFDAACLICHAAITIAAISAVDYADFRFFHAIHAIFSSMFSLLFSHYC